jgi:hypothetical protein
MKMVGPEGRISTQERGNKRVKITDLLKSNLQCEQEFWPFNFTPLSFDLPSNKIKNWFKYLAHAFSSMIDYVILQRKIFFPRYGIVVSRYKFLLEAESISEA